jgi:hypothetical protein
MARTMTFEAPTFMSIVATRAALAFGVGLLVSERLSPARRRVLGLGLVTGGLLSTVPAVHWVRRALRRGRLQRERFDDNAAMGRDERLVGITRFPRRGDDELTG